MASFRTQKVQKARGPSIRNLSTQDYSRCGTAEGRWLIPYENSSEGILYHTAHAGPVAAGWENFAESIYEHDNIRPKTPIQRYRGSQSWSLKFQIRRWEKEKGIMASFPTQNMKKARAINSIHINYQHRMTPGRTVEYRMLFFPTKTPMKGFYATFPRGTRKYC